MGYSVFIFGFAVLLLSSLALVRYLLDRNRYDFLNVVISFPLLALAGLGWIVLSLSSQGGSAPIIIAQLFVATALFIQTGLLFMRALTVRRDTLSWCLLVVYIPLFLAQNYFLLFMLVLLG